MITREELVLASSDMPPEECLERAFKESNKFRSASGIPMIPTSFYRSKEHQIEIYRKKGITDINKIPMGSHHIKGNAIDFGGKRIDEVKKWVLDNQDYCREQGWYFEDFNYTKNWVHFQWYSPSSGKLFFKP